MLKLTHLELDTLMVQMGLLLLAARLLGEVARRFKQPVVVGEILAGVLLGPTILGAISPEFFYKIFPLSGSTALTLNAIASLSAVMLLFIAGIEVELEMVWQEGRKALFTSFGGVIVPFVVGFGIAWFLPNLFEYYESYDRFLMPLFLGTALSISALPVIAKTLMDLDIFKTRLGNLIIASAMADDLFGWMMFSLIIARMGAGPGINLLMTLFLTLLFTFGMLTLGRILLDRSLTLVKKHFVWPGGVVAFALSLCFLGAAFTEFIGIHAIFGAFIVGVALGDSRHLSMQAREIIYQFVNNVFAPLFFATIGLKVNFVENFNLLLTLIVVFASYFGKLVGCGLISYWSGFQWREAMAIGFGMNARGAMVIILGLLALEHELIQTNLFVSLVIMALVTSITSGPLMKYFLKPTPATR
ncbi:MAG: cation:proton antiporter [Deltaproteobacteria bacterium]|nr:cation:proton antiporter [Deltaproteobacteria bacterium]